MDSGGQISTDCIRRIQYDKLRAWDSVRVLVGKQVPQNHFKLKWIVLMLPDASDLFRGIRVSPVRATSERDSDRKHDIRAVWIFEEEFKEPQLRWVIAVLSPCERLDYLLWDRVIIFCYNCTKTNIFCPVASGTISEAALQEAQGSSGYIK